MGSARGKEPRPLHPTRWPPSPPIALVRNTVAPHYQTWQIETEDGKVRTGMLIGTNLDEYTYLDAAGQTFKLNTRTIAASRAVPASIMADGLPDLLTDRELRDLLAYLCTRR